MEQSRQHLIKKTVFTILMAGISIVLAIVAVEVFFRIELGDDYAPSIYTPDLKIGKRYIKNIEIPQVGFMSFFDGTKMVMVTNRYHARINSMGFRGEDVSPADAGKTIVVALGDSCTFGYGEDEQNTFSAFLETMLNEKTPTKVYNIGISDYTSYQGLLWFREIVASLKPDFITINFCHNDSRNISERGPLWILPRKPDKEILGRPEIYGAFDRMKFFFMKNFILVAQDSAALSWLSKKLKIRSLEVTHQAPKTDEPNTPAPAPTPSPAPNPKNDPTKRVSVEDYGANITTIIEESRKLGAFPILITICHDLNYVAKASEVASAMGVPLLKSQEIFHGSVAEISSLPGMAPGVKSVQERYGAANVELINSLLFTNDFLHPNPVGHRILAERLSQIILTELENRKR